MEQKQPILNALVRHHNKGVETFLRVWKLHAAERGIVGAPIGVDGQHTEVMHLARLPLLRLFRLLDFLRGGVQ